MGKFVFKSILLCCFVLLGLSLTDTFFGTNHIYQETLREFSEHDKDDVSLVFFGNSHSYSSFDPRIFEVELGVESINMASGAQPLAATTVIADYVLKKTKPDLAIVNIFSASLSESNSDAFKKSSLVAIDHIPFSWQKMRFILENFSTVEWPSAFSETLRRHRKWPTITTKKNRFLFKPKHDFYKGYNTNFEKGDSVMYVNFKKKYEKLDEKIETLTIAEKKHIDNLIDIFYNNNIPVLFVNAPSDLYDLSQYNRTHVHAISKYIRKKSVRFLEFNEIKDSLRLNKHHYRNPNHLNTNGAIIVSQYLSKFIKDSLKINTRKRVIDLKNNRYAQVSDQQQLFYKQLDSTITEALFGIKEAMLYHIKENRYELLFPMISDSLGYQKVRLEHDVTPEVLTAYGKQRIFFNRDSTKVVHWGTLSNSNVLHYNDQHFAVFSLISPLKEFTNLSFHAGKNRSVKVFSIDTLTTSK